MLEMEQKSTELHNINPDENIGKVLVIDDNGFNLDLISDLLEEEDYHVFTAFSGIEGLNIAHKEFPDVILLDIMMPDMDGWEVCKRLKNNDITSNIPVLMISARTGVSNVIKSIEHGAAEFLGKPFENEELIIRVKSLFKMKRLEDKLRSINKNLSDEVLKRTQKLVEIEKFEILGKMVGSIAHDMNNLLSAIKMDNQLAVLSEDPAKKLKFLMKQQSSINLMESFIKSLMGIYAEKDIKKDSFSPLEKIKTVFTVLEKKLKLKSVKHEIIVNSDDIRLYANSSQYSQIVLNLVINAADAIEHNEGLITVTLDSDSEYVITSVKDNGTGIKDEDKDKIFDLLYTTKAEGHGTGIGLFTFAKIVENHSGVIELNTEVGKGTEFIFKLPVIDQSEKYKQFFK